MKTKILLFVISLFTWTACSDFLDERPKKSLVIPSTLEDLQAILDDYTNLVRDPSYGEISADDYFLTTEVWLSLLEEGHRRMYTWEKDYLFASGLGLAIDWLDVYRIVYAANTVLEKIEDISRHSKNEREWDNIKGQAHFLRARSFLSIANIWTLAYDAGNAKNTLGIPLRMESDFNISSKRASLEETYTTIINDLETASSILPMTSLHPTRASKPAAFGLLARTYLFMREYEKCWIAANSCLEIKDKLLDFNSLDEEKTFPIPAFNDEVIYVSHIGLPEPIRATRAKIDSTLYNHYHSNDLRKKIFFNEIADGTYSFKGSYMENTQFFSGLAVGEVYLMRAECAVRKGNSKDALKDLNFLLENRWSNGSFVPLNINDNDVLLDTILSERRKELLMRGIRWPDIKRLNMEGRKIVLKRNINNQIIELAPNDLRYALPIPEDIIRLSGMEQNPR